MLTEFSKVRDMGTTIKLMAFSRATPAEVVKIALPMPLATFAALNGFSRAEVSQCLAGYRPHEKVRVKLAEVLGVPREEVDSLLDTRAAA